jgi:hypothetical protein
MFLVLMAIQWLFWSGYVKPSLDAEFVPTAEFLLANPQPTPQFTQSGQLSVSDEICIAVVDSLYDGQSVSLFWSEIIVNNQRVGQADLSLSVLTTLLGVLRFCIANVLDSGIHIIEFKARGSQRQLLFSQQWAIEVE